MARLNESTTSVESVEILKRRFVRQNREIARVNSIQSLRIRSLESEVSHLLSENVSLREQVITLGQDLERFEAAKTLHDGVYDMKVRLDSKLRELSSLVAELGALPRQYSKNWHNKPEHECQKQTTTSMVETRYKTTNDASILGTELDGRLPVILEDKYFPRKTLEPQDLQQMDGFPESSSLKEAAASPTPELEDAGIRQEPLDNDTDVNALCCDGPDKISFPSTLETRKKKKNGSVAFPPTLQDGKERLSSVDSTPFLNARLALKCGAKRKFSPDDEEGFGPEQIEDDGFQFSRPVQSPLKLPSRVDNSPVKRKPKRNSNSMNHGQPQRKALESKSTNINILSPTKLREMKDYDQYEKKNTSDINENTVMYTAKNEPWGAQHVPFKPSISISCLENDETDGGERIFESKSLGARPITQSPLGLQQEEPGSAKVISTPPARPSRRRGAVVSYVEPNLRDKMRRPTNEFIAAVGGDKSKSSSCQSIQTETVKERSDYKSAGISTRKGHTSHATDGEFNCSHTEVLGSKSVRQMNMISHRKRKTSSTGKNDPLIEPSCGNSTKNEPHSSTVAGHQKEEEQENLGTASNALSNNRTKTHNLLTLGDARDSSTPVTQSAPGIERHSRRHSSNTKSSEPHFDIMIPEREPQSKSSEISIHEISIQPSSSVTGYQNHSNILLNTTELGRGQRAAARRRSMML